LKPAVQNLTSIHGAAPEVLATPIHRDAAQLLIPGVDLFSNFKSRCATLLVMVIAWCAVVHSTAAASNYPSVRKLSNGMRVLIVEDHLAPVVQTNVYYRFGALDETPGKTGLAHGLEHMMFRGTPSLNGDGLSDVVGQLGAVENAETHYDYTNFFFTMPSEKLELALHIEADRMQHLTLAQADWQLERGAVLTELTGDLGAPIGRLEADIRKAAYGSTNLGLPVGGNIGDVESSNVDDLRKYYDEWFAPNNATLVITGDVNTAAAFSLAQKYFQGIPARALPSHRNAQSEPATGKVITMRGDYPFAFLDIVYPFSGDIGGSLAAASALLPSAINSVRSPFYHALVEGGLVLRYDAYPEMTLHTGLFHMSMSITPGHTPAEVRAVVEKTMQEFAQNGPAPELLDTARRDITSQGVYERDSISGLADRVGYSVGYEGFNNPGVDDTEVLRTTRAQVVAAARQYLSKPAIVGQLISERVQSAAPPPKPASAITDDFSKRAATGAPVEAEWVRSALESPLRGTSKVLPVHYKLHNGLNVYVQRVTPNPTVYIVGSIEASPRLDPPGKEGVALLASLLLNYGSNNYSFASRNRLADQLSASIDIGQNFSAYGMARDFPKLIDVLADALRHPVFPSNYLELNRSNFLGIYSRRDSNPGYLAYHGLLELMLPPGDVALREPTVESLRSITRQDIVSYARRYQRPDLTSITVVGDVTPEQVHRIVERSFASWSNEGPTPDVSLAPVPVPQAAQRHIGAVTDTVTVSLAQPAPPRESPDYYSLTVLNTILGESGKFDTRLLQQIRVRRGLVYNVSSSYDAAKYRGFLNFHLSATPANVRPAVALLKAQLRDLQQNGVSQTELDHAKKYIAASTLLHEQSIRGIAEDVANIGASDLPLTYYQTRQANFNRLTAADIQRAAKDYLKPDNLVEVYTGPAF